jgi:hypothetical protein
LPGSCPLDACVEGSRAGDVAEDAERGWRGSDSGGGGEGDDLDIAPGGLLEGVGFAGTEEFEDGEEGDDDFEAGGALEDGAAEGEAAAAAKAFAELFDALGEGDGGVAREDGAGAWVGWFALEELEHEGVEPFDADAFEG